MENDKQREVKDTVIDILKNDQVYVQTVEYRDLSIENDDQQITVVLTTKDKVKSQKLADLIYDEWEEGAIKVWSVTAAARRIDGKLQESLDVGHMSHGHPLMIEYADYHRLKDEMLRLQERIRNVPK